METIRGGNVSIFQTILDLIAMRSFSNLWYWIALAVTWSSASHWVLGIPFDMVLRANRKGGQAEADLMALTRINVARLMTIAREAGLVLAIMVPALHSFLLITGFFYGSELAQAVFLILFPLTLVWALGLKRAAYLEQALRDEVPVGFVIAQLSKHRITVQAIGILAITLAAFWGMYMNLRYSVL